MLVSPPSHQCCIWCASTKRVSQQPGKRQPQSRRRSARRIAGGMVRVLRPTLSTLPAPSSMTLIRLASQARRRCRGERRQKLTIFDLTDSLVVVCGEIGIEMHHDLVFIASRERAESIAQCSKRLFGQGQQRIGAFLGKACSRLVFQKRSRGNVFCC